MGTILIGFQKASLEDLKYFTLEINEIAAFPNTQSNIIAAISEPCMHLSKLHSQLMRFCSAASDSLDSHIFRPHITLGRSKNPGRMIFRPIMIENTTINATYYAKSFPTIFKYVEPTISYQCSN